MVYSKLPDQQAAIGTLQQHLDQCQWPHCPHTKPWPLEITNNGLVLHDPHHRLQALHIDYLSGRMRHRQSHSTQPERLAQAVRLKNKPTLSIWDLTAGLGMDGYRLASLGHDVTLIEQHPLLACIVEEALQRANTQSNKPLHIACHHQSAQNWCQQTHTTLPDVIILDPMFPARKKSAAVSEQAKWLQHLVGHDAHQTQQDLALLRLALQYAKHRVVVKRPAHAPPLSDITPSSVLPGKRIRYDMYCAPTHAS
jgi:16S rRNA (guanine1516-N2)-methyltransferase